MAGKFYAVKKGKVPGIYTSWDACKSMVHGFPGAVYKGFATRAEAEQFLEEKKEEQKEPENYAFVDGSFNSATSVYGYGGFLVLGSMAAVKEAVAMGLTDLTIYYDYMGIEMWATGAWKRNKQGTIAYYDFIQSVNDKISLHFVKVKGHSGVEGNEEADRLARLAAGVD